MRILVALAAALALAACGGGDEVTQEPDTAAVAPAADSPLIGAYGGVDMDGKAWASRMNADGTYEDSIDGEVTESGNWTHEGDQVCFTPAPVDGAAADATCLTLVNVNDDGSLLMADSEGNETTVPRLAE